MTNTFYQAVQSRPDSQTENWAPSLSTSGSRVLDFFNKAPALRHDPKRAADLFEAAYREHQDLAIRALFWARDARGGAGQRNIFRHSFARLIHLDQDRAIGLLPMIPEFGYWKDLVHLALSTRGPVHDQAVSLIGDQLLEDAYYLKTGQDYSLLAKWMPRIPKQAGDLKQAVETLRKELNFKSQKDYRLFISRLTRGRTLADGSTIGPRPVETPMSARRWDSIDYSRVPSQAMLRYQNAFRKHDTGRFLAYMDDVAAGREKINTQTLFPHQITRKIAATYDRDEIRDLETIWDNLPDYVNGGRSMLVVADGSRSMYSPVVNGVAPIDIATAIAIYAAERNRGPWVNAFVSFSREPQLVDLSPFDNLKSKIDHVRSFQALNTDLEAVFRLIMNVAWRAGLRDEQLPESILIISDMQFDHPDVGGNRTNFEVIQEMYAQAGYTMPTLVFWCARAGADQPVSMHESGTALISGSSPAILGDVLTGGIHRLTPYKLMMKTLDKPRYVQLDDWR